MVMMEDLLMEVVTIIIQHLSNAFDIVVEDIFQFRPLNFIQKRLNSIKKIYWRSELLSCQCALHVIEKPEVRKWPSQDDKPD
jgi:hypothetical protein